MKISILHPSRGRPLKSLHTINRWASKCSVEIQVIVSLDSDDTYYNNYVYEYSHDWSQKNYGIMPEIIHNTNRSAVDAINNAAKEATGDILIVVSDDTDCPDNWAFNLLKEVEGKKDFILKCQDGIQPWIITMPVMDMAYYNRFGYVYYPEYMHMFCDTELSCVADLTGRRINSNLLFPHLHYSTGKSAQDSISKRADATWQQGEELFLSRYKKGFDIENPAGKITDRNTISWADSKLRTKR